MNDSKNDGEIKFNALLVQIEQCLHQKSYFVAIMVSLVIPDIGGAIDSDNGKATQKTYTTWFDKFFKSSDPGYPNLTGDECYYLRCSMLHQGKIKSDNRKLKVAFMDFPQSNSLTIPFLYDHNDLGLLIEPRAFCNNMINAAYSWLDIVHDNNHFKKNMINFMTLYRLSFTNVQ